MKYISRITIMLTVVCAVVSFSVVGVGFSISQAEADDVQNPEEEVNEVVGSEDGEMESHLQQGEVQLPQQHEMQNHLVEQPSLQLDMGVIDVAPQPDIELLSAQLLYMLDSQHIILVDDEDDDDCIDDFCQSIAKGIEIDKNAVRKVVQRYHDRNYANIGFLGCGYRLLHSGK